MNSSASLPHLSADSSQYSTKSRRLAPLHARPTSAARRRSRNASEKATSHFKRVTLQNASTSRPDYSASDAITGRSRQETDSPQAKLLHSASAAARLPTVGSFSSFHTQVVSYKRTPLAPHQTAHHPQVHPHRLWARQHLLSHCVQLRPTAQTVAAEKRLLFQLSQKLIRTILTRKDAVVGPALARKLLPTLTPALVELMRAIDQNERKRAQNPQAAKLNPINWLAQFLFRNNPKFGVPGDAARNYGQVIEAVILQEENRVHGAKEVRVWSSQTDDEHRAFLGQFLRACDEDSGSYDDVITNAGFKRLLEQLQQVYSISTELKVDIQSMLTVLDVEGHGYYHLNTVLHVIDRVMADKNTLSLTMTRNTVITDDGELGVTRDFSDFRQKLEEQRETWLHDECVRIMDSLLQQHNYDVDSLFRLFDVNRNGRISALEIRMALDHLSNVLQMDQASTVSQSLALFRELDLKNTGEIDLPQFRRWMRQWLAGTATQRLRRLTIVEAKTAQSPMEQRMFRERAGSVLGSSSWCAESLGISSLENKMCEADLLLTEAERQLEMAQCSWLERENNRKAALQRVQDTLRLLNQGRDVCASPYKHMLPTRSADSPGTPDPTEAKVAYDFVGMRHPRRYSVSGATSNAAAAARLRLEQTSLQLVSTALVDAQREGTQQLVACFRTLQGAAASREAANAATQAGRSAVAPTAVAPSSADARLAQDRLFASCGKIAPELRSTPRHSVAGKQQKASQQAEDSAAQYVTDAQRVKDASDSAAAAVAKVATLTWLVEKSHEKSLRGGRQCLLAERRLAEAKSKWRQTSGGGESRLAVAASHLGLTPLNQRNGVNSRYVAASDGSDEAKGGEGPAESVMAAAVASIASAEEALAFAGAVHQYMHACSAAHFKRQSLPRHPQPPPSLDFLAHAAAFAHGPPTSAASAAQCVQAYSDYEVASKAAAARALGAKSAVARAAALVQIARTAREAEDSCELQSLLDSVAQSALVGLGAVSAYVFLRCSATRMRCVSATTERGGVAGATAMRGQQLRMDEGITLPPFARGRRVVHVPNVMAKPEALFLLGHPRAGAYVARPLLDSVHGHLIGYVAADTLPTVLDQSEGSDGAPPTTGTASASAWAPASTSTAATASAPVASPRRCHAPSPVHLSRSMPFAAQPPLSVSIPFGGGPANDFSPEGLAYFEALVNMLGSALPAAATTNAGSNRKGSRTKGSRKGSSKGKGKQAAAAGSRSRSPARKPAAASAASASAKSSSGSNSKRSDRSGSSGSSRRKGGSRGRKRDKKTSKAAAAEAAAAAAAERVVPVVSPPVSSVAHIERRRRVAVIARSVARVLEAQTCCAPAPVAGGRGEEEGEEEESVEEESGGTFCAILTRAAGLRFLHGSGRFEALVRSGHTLTAATAPSLFELVEPRPPPVPGVLPLPVEALATLNEKEAPGPCVAWALRDMEGNALAVMGLAKEDVTPQDKDCIHALREVLAQVVPEEWPRSLADAATAAATPAAATDSLADADSSAAAAAAATAAAAAPSPLQRVMGAEARAHMALSRQLVARMRYRLTGLVTEETARELRSYTRPPRAIADVVRAVLLLLGSSPNSLPTWAACKAVLATGALARIPSFDPTSEDAATIGGPRGRQRLEGVRAVLRRWNKREVLQRGSRVVGALFEWAVAAVEVFALSVRVMSAIARQKRAQAALCRGTDGGSLRITAGAAAAAATAVAEKDQALASIDTSTWLDMVPDE